MEISEIHCTSILTRAGGYLRPVCSHSLNPYIGCGFGRSGCGVGCYVQFNAWLTRGRPWGGFVEVKLNAAEVYSRTCDAERRWAHRRQQPFSIFLASSTEPWQPVEARYRITRQVLRAMRDHPPDTLILQTHATGIREDLDLVSALAERCRLRVHVSIESDIERLPGLPPPPASLADRIQLLRDLSAAGLQTVACLSPLYPVREPHGFFQTLADTGASGVVIDHFIQGDGTKDGSRTFKTDLPRAIREVSPDGLTLDYRDRIAAIAREYLPVGISSAGFAGKFLEKKP